MVRSGDGQRSVAPKLFIFDERPVFTGQDHLPGRTFEPDGPIVGIARVLSPGIRMEIVDEIPAADDEHTFFAQRRKSTADLKVEYGRLGFVDAELHDRHVGVGIYMAEDRPRSVIQAPGRVERYRSWREQVS